MKKLLLILLLVFIHQVNAQYTKLYDFNNTNGSSPYGSLISDGTYLYGMTTGGGVNNYGVIFKILPNGTGYTDLFDFNGLTGQNPYGSLISDGTFLYGTAMNNYMNSNGVVFKIKSNGTGYDTLHNDTYSSISHTDGALYYDGIFLYGLIPTGGTSNNGNIYKILPNGTGYTDLFDFNFTNGATPIGSLISDGTFLYGVTNGGGSNGSGIIYKIKPDGTGYDTLLNFSNVNYGANPNSSLIYDGTYLYGMTYNGGTNLYGNIYKIKPNGTGYDTIISFNGINGRLPIGTLAFDGTFLYGTTQFGGIGSCTYGCGVLFKIKPDGTGYSKLHDFTNTTSDGGFPNGNLLYDGACLYGMTNGGGSNSGGTIFKYCGIADIEQLSTKEENVIVFPNPCTDKITVSSSSIIDEVIVVDVLGQTIYEAKPHKESISLQLDNAGIYFVTISIDKEVRTERVIINK